MTELPDDYHARAMMFAAKVDELALLVAGEPVERLTLLLDTVHEGLEDVLSETMIELFLECVIRRKVEMERNAMPLERQ